MNTGTDQWWSHHDNLVTLTAWMADHDWSAHDVASAVEKPWKYDDEWQECNAELEAEA